MTIIIEFDPEIFKDIIDYIKINYNSNMHLKEVDVDIIDIESPDLFSPEDENNVRRGKLSIENTGSVGGNVIIEVVIRTPDYDPISCYYLTEYLEPGQQHTFDTYYYGFESDFFRYEPYLIEFQVYMHGKYVAFDNDYFFVGLMGYIDEMANVITESAKYAVVQGMNEYRKIKTAVEDVWTIIWGGFAQSNIDLRLWDENRETLLVGLNYTTNKTLNLSSANYCGPSANPEYIKIPNPNGETYYLEIIGVELPFSQDTTVTIINIGQRNATLGVPYHINATNYFFSI